MWGDNVDLFLDSCIIISYHIPCHPHNKIVSDFYDTHNINSQTTCKRVEKEVNKKLREILEEFKNSGELSDSDIRKIRHAVRKFFRNIPVDDFSTLNTFLFNDLDIELEKVMKNSSDRAIFANAILWNLHYNPANPIFLTLDKKDYRNTWGIMLAVTNCLNNNGHNVNNLKKLIEIMIL